VPDPFHEIKDGLWFIQGKNRGRYVYSNSLLIDDTPKILIDTGMGRGVIRKLVKQFGQPDIVLYSHGHEDHIGNSKLFTATCYIHENDREMATSQEELIRLYGISSPALIEVLNSFFKSFHYYPLTQVETFQDGRIFPTENFKIKVLHMPGHSAGHCCFEIQPTGLIFSSDIDLTGFGPWYGALDSDIPAFERSINQLIRKSPNLLVTSHKGIIIDDIQERLRQFRQKIVHRTEILLAYLQKERSFEEMVRQALIHGHFGEPLDYYLVAERVMLQKHLSLLLEQGKIVRRGDLYRLVR